MRVLIALVAVLFGFSATAAAPYRMEGVVLLQPESVFEERAQSAASLADYIDRARVAAEQALAGAQPHPAGGFLVFAIRPSGRSMVWLDFTPGLPEQTASDLRKALLGVPGAEVRNGVIVFALKSSLWGGTTTQEMPSPAEWKKAMKGSSGPMEIGALVDKIWPGDAGS